VPFFKCAWLPVHGQILWTAIRRLFEGIAHLGKRRAPEFCTQRPQHATLPSAIFLGNRSFSISKTLLTRNAEPPAIKF
jgi:hypothetical protein